jgi:excisionase family DNA binding protein
MTSSPPQPPPSPDDAAWDARDVARFLKLARTDSVLALVRSGRLPAVQLGRRWRFSPAAVRAFLEGKPVEPPVRKARAGMPEWMRGVPKVIRR